MLADRKSHHNASETTQSSPSRDKVVVDAVALFLRDAERPLVTRRGEERVALRDPLLEDGVELLGRLADGAAERLFGHAEAHREDRATRIRVDRVRDRLEEVREALHALRLRRRHAEQDDVRVRRDRVRPLDVEVGLTGPALGAGRPRLAVADVLEVRRAVRPLGDLDLPVVREPRPLPLRHRPRCSPLWSYPNLW